MLPVPDVPQFNLTPQDIREFQDIFETEFSEKLPPDESATMAQRLLGLYSILATEPRGVESDPPKAPQKLGEELSEREAHALRFLHNAIVHEGRSPSVRELARELGKSTRTAFKVLNGLIERGWVRRGTDDRLVLIEKTKGAENCDFERP